MRILVLCPHFAPDLHAATGEVMTELVRSLAGRGHTVDVVTSLPWYRDHDVEPEWKGRPVRSEVTDFGSVTRVWPFPTDKGSVVSRSLAFVAQTALSLVVAMPKKRPDVVLAMSPPIFFGSAGRLLARRFRVPFVFNVQDIFPDVAVELDMLTNERAIRIARRLERSLYDSAHAVTVLSEDQARNVRAKIAQPDKVKVIPNFVDISRVRVVDRMTDYRRSHQIGDELVVMYSGNVGFSQSFHLVEAAAIHFADRSDVRFVINGEGAARADVERWARRLPNVIISDFAPREKVSDVLGTADLHLILLSAGLAKSSTPSKLYGIMAAGRPVLASIDLGSDADRVIHRSGAGLTVAPDDPAAFIAALDRLLADRVELERLGSRAKQFVGQLMTPDQQAQAYESLFVQLASL
jgi:colanic acid biosynthesis glycosyl transferase WcaI